MFNDNPPTNQYSTLNPVETWIKALTQPNVNSYREIVNDPAASLGKAALWLAVAGLIGGFISGVANWLFGFSFFDQLAQYGDYNLPTSAGSFMSVISGTFGGAFFTLLGAFVLTGIVQIVAKMLGGTGTYDKLFYGFAAYLAPLNLVTNVLGIIPIVSCITPLIGIYGLVLNVIANQATHEYDTGKAVISSLTPVLIFALFCCCIIVFFGSMLGAVLGPTTGGIFETIQATLQP